MPFKVHCACGRDLVAKEEMLGKKVRCPACKAILVVQKEGMPTPVRAGGPPPLAKPPGPPSLAKLPAPKRPPAAKPPLPDDEEDEEDGGPKSRKVRERMRALGLVNVGLL